MSVSIATPPDAPQTARAAATMRGLELALAETTGRKTSELSMLPQAGPGVAIRDSAVAGWAYFLLDTLITTEDELVLIEANASNAALSSTVHYDIPRARHMVDMLLAGCAAAELAGAVVLLCHATGFHHVAEFVNRSLTFASELQRRGVRVALKAPGEALRADELSLVVGPIPAIAADTYAEHGAMSYQGRRVALATNANLLPALERREAMRGGWPRTGGVMHCGFGSAISHDRTLQQVLARGTGFTTLAPIETWTVEAAAAAVASFTANSSGAVVKMNAGSGGSGVVAISPTSTRAAAITQIDAALADAETKYGSRLHTTAFPLRVCRFAQASPFVLADGGHLWDLRTQILVRPGIVEIAPAIVRLCPEPFNGRYTRAATIANLTGRPASLEWVRPVDDVLATVGDPGEYRARLVTACARWVANASRWAMPAL